MKTVTHPALVFCLLGALLALPLRAAEAIDLAGMRFTTGYPPETPQLQLRGAAVKRHLGWFDVFAAALYSPEDAPAAAILAKETPKRLEIAYLRSISAEDLIKATRTVLEDQHPQGLPVNLQQELQRLFASMEDVQAADRYALSWFPDEGLHLEFNGKTLFRSRSAEFSRLYFGIWLAADPLSESLRQALLKPSETS